jgi:hypothetical protein
LFFVDILKALLRTYCCQRLNIRPIWGMAKISMINYDHYQQDVTEENDKWDIKKAKEWILKCVCVYIRSGFVGLEG